MARLRLARLDSEPAPAPESLGPLGFDAVFERFSPYVAGTAIKILGRDDEVDDVIQEVFLACSRREEPFPTAEDARRWLSTVTVRIACHRLRRRRMRSFWTLSLEKAHFHVPTAHLSPEEHAQLRRLYRVLDQLPIPERTAWVLRHLQGERLDDVAEACGCSLATVKRRIAAASQAVAEVFRDD